MGSSTTAPWAELPTPVKKIHKALLPLFVSLVVVTYLDRTSLAFAALQLCRSDWFNARVYGLGSGVFYAGYVLFQIPSNLLLSRLGAKLWLPLITAAFGAVAVCSALFIRGPASFYVLRLALGIAEAGVFPGMWEICGQFYPNSFIVVPYSIIEASIAVSQIIAAPAAAALLQLSGLAGLQGWQFLFLAEGFATLVVAGVLRWRLPASVGTAPFLSEPEKAWLMEQLGCHTAAATAAAAALGPGAAAEPRQQQQHAGAGHPGMQDDDAVLLVGSSREDSSGGGSSGGGGGAAAAGGDCTWKSIELAGHSTGSNIGSKQHLDGSKTLSSGSHFHISSGEEHHRTHHVGTVSTHQQHHRHEAPSNAAAAPGVSGIQSYLCGSSGGSGEPLLSSWQQVSATFSNRLILYLMLLKALKDIALDGLVYWVPMLVHALIDGNAVSLSVPSSSGSSGGEQKHCGGKESQLQAVLLSSIPFGTAAVAALLVGYSSERRQERRLHVGLPLLLGGCAFMLLPLLLQLPTHLPAFLMVTAAVVAADATTGPFWSWVNMAAAPGTGAVSLAAVNSVGKAGGFLGPLSFGLILHATGSYVPSILLVGAVLLCGGAMALLYAGERHGRRYQKLPDAAHREQQQQQQQHELAQLQAS